MNLKFIDIFKRVSLNQVRNLSLLYLLLIVSFFIFKINDNFLGSDYSNYIQGADSIFTSLPYSTHGDPSLADNFRPPGYPFLIAISKLITKNYFNELLICFQIIIFFSMYLILLLILKIFQIYTKVSILLSAFMFSHPVLVFTATQVQCDLMLGFFVCLFIYFFILYTQKRQKQFLILAILSISISVYFRPTYLYYIPILLVIITFIYNYKFALYSSGVLLMVISPWIIRNKIVLNTTSFSEIGSVAFSYYAAEAIRISENIPAEEAHLMVLKSANVSTNLSLVKNDFAAMGRLKKSSLAIIKKNLFSFFLSCIRGYARVFIMPHNIFSIKKNTTLNVDEFIKIMKSNPRLLFKNINFYFLYLYVIPYVINGIFCFCLFVFALNFKKYFKRNYSIFLVMFSILTYGFLIPGPINRSQYMLSYFLILVFISIIVFKRQFNYFKTQSFQK